MRISLPHYKLELTLFNSKYGCRRHLEISQNGRHQIFISYRVKADQTFASSLAEHLERSLRCNVFLDYKCLVVGENWQCGFVNTLLSDALRVFIVLISPEAMKPFHTADKANDNMLLEMQMALERRHFDSEKNETFSISIPGSSSAVRVKRNVTILPIFLGDRSKIAFPRDLPNELPHHKWSNLASKLTVQGYKHFAIFDFEIRTTPEYLSVKALCVCVCVCVCVFVYFFFPANSLFTVNPCRNCIKDRRSPIPPCNLH